MTLAPDSPNDVTPVRLGLLDFYDLAPGRSVRQKHKLALESAEAADAVGYTRFWIPEHHGKGSPSASPLVLAAGVGARTSRIRVGTAVTLLRVRDPYLTAVDIAHAAACCDGRLDIGFGRGDVGGPGSDIVASLRKDDAGYERALDLVTTLLDRGHDLLDPLSIPHERWMHGKASRSAELAAARSFNYCHALFLSPDLETCTAAIASYRQNTRNASGRTAVAITLVVNDDTDRARLDGQRQPYRVNFTGALIEAVDMIQWVAATTGADEVILAELSEDPECHLESIQEIGRALLPPQPQISPEVPAEPNPQGPIANEGRVRSFGPGSEHRHQQKH
ncbi:LLM class flavin-dependent oxidoreductase, partial [Rhodococcus marinonascens]|uniref:LLM class flavin-dependent oxidoreductase n=1 Tax=Rhodococcus marinonascens TaxID=38311 RepID=UPI000A97954D